MSSSEGSNLDESEEVEEEFDDTLARIKSNDSTLTEVNLRNRGIGDDGVRRLSEALPHNTFVKYLFLANNGITADGIGVLARMLRTNSTITFLRLDDNDIGAGGARVLAEQALQANSSVRKIFLGGCNIGDDGVTSLAEALRNGSSVIDLRLTRNNIGDAGATALAQVIPTNSTIITMNLCLNSIGDAGATALAAALRVNSAITNIFLARNIISDEGAGALLDALLANSSVSFLLLNGNNISDDLVAKVIELLQINRDTSDPEEAHRRKVKARIGCLLKTEDTEEEDALAAISLTLGELERFPKADQRRGLFEQLLGGPHGESVASSIDLDQGRVLYWYAAECCASPVVLMNLLRAHPSLCSCKDTRHRLYPFGLLATMPEPEDGNEATITSAVMEALLLDPSLVEGGIPCPPNAARKRRKVVTT